MDQSNKILVLGIGNYLMGDEGVGVHLAECLQQDVIPGVDVVDGGTGGFHLLGLFEGYDTIILADATLDNNPPGTIRCIHPRFASDFPKAMSTHDIGLKDMVGALQLLEKMPRIFLYIVSIESLQQQGVTLTAPLQHALPLLKDMVLDLIALLQPAVKHVSVPELAL